MFKGAKERPVIVKKVVKTKGRVKPHANVTIKVNRPEGVRYYNSSAKSTSSQIAINQAFHKANNKAIYSPSDSTSYRGN